METRLFSRGWFTNIISYSSIVWTIFCFIGAWFVIFKYDVLRGGSIETVMIFLFAAAIWAILFAGLIFLSLCLTPSEEPSYYVMFKDLIKKGIRRVQK